MTIRIVLCRQLYNLKRALSVFIKGLLGWAIGAKIKIMIAEISSKTNAPILYNSLGIAFIKITNKIWLAKDNR
jgi:hypothetical protein